MTLISVCETLKRETPNYSNTGVGNNKIPNGVNTFFGIAVHYDIPLSFGLDVYGEEKFFLESLRSILPIDHIIYPPLMILSVTEQDFYLPYVKFHHTDPP